MTSLSRSFVFLVISATLIGCAPQKPGVASLYNCGDTPLSAEQEDNDTVSLNINGKILNVSPVPASSGAKYRSLTPPPAVTFWNKDGEATLIVDDKQYPACQLVRNSLYIDTTNYRAIGNGPSWYATIINDELHLTTHHANRELTSPMPAPRMTLYGQYYSVRSNEHVMSMTIKNKTCTDSLSGQYYPNTVSIIFDGEVFVGCGINLALPPGLAPAPQPMPEIKPVVAEPVKVDMIIDKTWVAKEIDGHELMAPSHTVLTFGKDGKLVGNGGCNAFSGSYKISGKTLKIDPKMIATQMACESGPMVQDKTFTTILKASTLIELRDGSLIISTPHRQTIMFAAE